MFITDKNLFFSNLSKFVGIKIEFIDSHSKVINKSPSSHYLIALKLCNRFRKSEYNHFPIINLGFKFCKYLAYFISPIFLLSKLIKIEVVEKYLNNDKDEIFNSTIL